MSTKRRIFRKATMLILAVGATVALASAGGAASYYVDDVNGNDGNSGKKTAPWKTVAKVNDAAFAPGDTIFFKAGGSWKEPLHPKSGSRSGNVTYRAYGSGAMPVIESCVMHNVSFVILHGLKFISSDAIPLDLQGASHNTIRNCAIYADVKNSAAWTALFVRDGSSYNKILNNAVERRNLESQGNAVSIGTNTNYNLVQGNTFGMATHYSFDIIGAYNNPSEAARYNVIRNNIIHNPEGAVAEMIMNADYNVFEGNLVSGGKSTQYDAKAGNSLSLGGSHNIIRNNIIKDNPGIGDGIAAISFASGGLSANVVGNRVYNNTFANISYIPVVLGSYGGSTIDDNIFKNNIIANNPTRNGVQISATQEAGSYVFINNLIYNRGTADVLSVSRQSKSVAAATSRHSANFSGNIQQDPMLDSNYNPLPGSPARSGGAHLTSVASASGSGKTLAVKDAGYFTDGFGIVRGDTIRIGEETATIRKVDYANNTITVTKRVSWKSGDPVSLAHDGARPSIGASIEWK